MNQLSAAMLGFFFKPALLQRSKVTTFSVVVEESIYLGN